jgi:hypothetical protein
VRRPCIDCLLAAGVGISLGLSIAVMGGCTGTLPPNTVPVAVATIETAICILNVANKDAGQPAGKVVSDAIEQCGTDAATIARVLDAHHAAEVSEQFADGGP